MQDRTQEGRSSNQRRSNLQPLAPRDSRPASTSREPISGSPSTSRPPRLSHRSRAGCWTCRGRKVKCDEVHPRCGPCTRLNRECDWVLRWSFSDATCSTQDKYSNVNTSGNVVWDEAVRQSVSPVLRQQDDLPDFAALTSDEDRERKAITRRPGTFGVVVTPESFHDLPEYAAAASGSPFSSRRTSARSNRGGYGSPRPGITRSSTQPAADPNTVILDKFEDLSPASSGPFTLAGRGRRSSFPEGLQGLSISTPSYTSEIVSAPSTAVTRPDEPLIRHFRQYIVPRLVQPQQESIPSVISQGSTRDVLEEESTRFQPLYHAICAISALNLAYNGRSTLEEAMQHYHQALAASATATTPNDLLSDGVFFRHFLLFIYDICIPMQADDGGADMWAEHLNHLRRIALHRHQTNRREPYAYTLWTICELDMYACLMGSGNCEFIHAISGQHMLPPLEQQVPCIASVQTPGAGAFMPHEVQHFPPVLQLNEGIILCTAKLAAAAQSFRSEPTSGGRPTSPGTYARWQAATAQLQNDLHNCWQQTYPEHLGRDLEAAAASLPERIRSVFENAILLYHAATIYSRTSMFRGQARIPVAGQYDIDTDTDGRIQAILGIATQRVENGHVDRRHTVFPVFMAGFAARGGDAKIHAIDLIRAFEGSGIGQNTFRTRQLLVAVCEEQRRVHGAGGRIEDVDWVSFSRDRGLTVVNCGL